VGVGGGLSAVSTVDRAPNPGGPTSITSHLKVDLLKSTLSKAANDLAGQGAKNEAARQALEGKR